MGVKRRASQASVGLVVLGLHLAGVLLWWTAERGMQWVRSEARLPSIAVWLPPLRTLETKLPSGESTHKPPVREANTPAERRPAQTVTVTSPSAGITMSAPMEPSGPTEVQNQTEMPTAPTWNLHLSRAALSSVAPPSFAEQSPFHGRLPTTVERQIANAAAETGPWTEERIDNDHIRFRRGNTCVTMQRPRAASIDPFNEAASRIPWRASGAEACQ